MSAKAKAKAKKAVGQSIRRWQPNRRGGSDLSRLAEHINAQVRGWINYYGAFCRSELFFLQKRLNEHLVQWEMRKFKRSKYRPRMAWQWIDAVKQQIPRLFAHWWAGGSPKADPWAG